MGKQACWCHWLCNTREALHGSGTSTGRCDLGPCCCYGPLRHAPAQGPSEDSIRQIMAADALNQSRAEGAPQQSVVNGWTARDLLELVAQSEATGQDPRPAALLTLAVLGIALILFTGSTV